MKAGWTEVALGEICEFRYGKALKAGDRSGDRYPVYGSNGVVGRHTTALTAGATIVIGRKGSYGEVHRSEVPCWPIDTTYYIDASATACDLRWLTYALRGLRLTELNRAAAVPGLNREDAYRRRLALPPLDEQRRIARVLDAAEAVRTMRRRSIESASSFAAALYRTMFGGIHPTCEVTTLGQVSDVTSGITKGRRINGRVLTEVPYLAVSNVQAGHLDMTNVKTIEASEPEIARFRLAPGDLLLTEGGDPDKLGRGTLWSGELDVCIHQNHIFRVRVHDPDQVDPVFLQGQVASAAARSYFLRAAKQTTGIASINRTQLQALPVQLPPIDLQCSFTERLRLAARAVAARERHLAHLDALFASLQHRAFTGAL